MNLIDREDLELVPLVFLALLLRWARLSWCRNLVATQLATLAFHFSREKRRLTEEALSAAFGSSLSKARRDAIVFGSMLGVWTELFALVAGPVARTEFDPCRVIGLDRLRTSLSAGRGAILWESNGFAYRWAAKRILKENGHLLQQVHGYQHLGGLKTSDPKGSWIRGRITRPLINRFEEYYVERIIDLPSDGSVAVFRDMRRQLADNKILCIAGDGLTGQKRLGVPYLGQTLHLATGMVSLAKATGAAIHPLFCLPLETGGSETIIEKRIPIMKAGSANEIARKALEDYAMILEQRVRARPELYRNWFQVARENAAVPTS